MLNTRSIAKPSTIYRWRADVLRLWLRAPRRIIVPLMTTWQPVWSNKRNVCVCVWQYVYLLDLVGIDLENIVYYKDDTHYFVMTAKKQSLLEKGVILHVSDQSLDLIYVCEGKQFLLPFCLSVVSIKAILCALTSKHNQKSVLLLLFL